MHIKAGLKQSPVPNNIPKIAKNPVSSSEHRLLLSSLGTFLLVCLSVLPITPSPSFHVVNGILAEKKELVRWQKQLPS